MSYGGNDRHGGPSYRQNSSDMDTQGFETPGSPPKSITEFGRQSVGCPDSRVSRDGPRRSRRDGTHHFGTANDTVFHARRGITASDVGFGAGGLYIE